MGAEGVQPERGSIQPTAGRGQLTAGGGQLGAGGVHRASLQGYGPSVSPAGCAVEDLRLAEGSQSTEAQGPYSTHRFEPTILFLSCWDQPKAAAAPKTGRGAGTDAGAEMRGVAIA